MKIFKHILMIILSIISIPCAILMTTGCIWYTLPMIQTTKLGLLITNNIPNIFFIYYHHIYYIKIYIQLVKLLIIQCKTIVIK